MADHGQAYVQGRLVGKLVGFQNSDKGFAFLSTGPSTPQYFVHRKDVSAEDWFDGSLLEFTPAAPRKEGQNMRATDIVSRNEQEKAS